MKSTIKKIEQEENLFPKLMKRNTADEIVVLFYCNESGTVVNSGASVYRIGVHSIEWNMDEFEDFNDILELHN